LIERMSMKKATSTRSVMVEGFGLDQCGGRSDERREADNPFKKLDRKQH
jgi:hypothetical protein